MRRLNAFLSAAIILLFLDHAIIGSFQMLGWGATVLKFLARAMLTLAVIHACIGIKLTIDSFRAMRQSGVSYPWENRMFWVRRISGFLLLGLLVFHSVALTDYSGTQVRLVPFDGFLLCVHLLMAAVLAVHVLSNMLPMFISFGAKHPRERASEFLVVFTVILVFTAAAFIIYYLRWNTL